jgi:hypothetical protein
MNRTVDFSAQSHCFKVLLNDRRNFVNNDGLIGHESQTLSQQNCVIEAELSFAQCPNQATDSML